jgi:large conductance mechanosensitive channel
MTARDEERTMLKGFRDFVMRGNVVDLAVGIVIGVAFGAVVTGFVNGIINPIIAAIFGKPNLDHVGTFTINGAHFSIGLVLTPLINFLFVAAAIYFLVVVPMNALRARYVQPADPAGPSEVELLTEIRDSLQTRG